MLHCCYIVLCYEILQKNRPVCWSIVVKEKTAVGSPYFEEFPFLLLPWATKEVTVHLFIHSTDFCKFYQRIQGTF